MRNFVERKLRTAGTPLPPEQLTFEKFYEDIELNYFFKVYPLEPSKKDTMWRVIPPVPPSTSFYAQKKDFLTKKESIAYVKEIKIKWAKESMEAYFKAVDYLKEEEKKKQMTEYH